MPNLVKIEEKERAHWRYKKLQEEPITEGQVLALEKYGHPRYETKSWTKAQALDAISRIKRYQKEAQASAHKEKGRSNEFGKA